MTTLCLLVCDRQGTLSSTRNRLANVPPPLYWVTQFLRHYLIVYVCYLNFCHTYILIIRNNFPNKNDFYLNKRIRPIGDTSIKKAHHWFLPQRWCGNRTVLNAVTIITNFIYNVYNTY